VLANVIGRGGIGLAARSRNGSVDKEAQFGLDPRENDAVMIAILTSVV
jgi:hypothetical protein